MSVYSPPKRFPRGMFFCIWFLIALLLVATVCDREYLHSIALEASASTASWFFFWTTSILRHHKLWSPSFFVTKYSASSSPRVLNVHIVPHTHDDVGWLKTVQQYYEGTNHSIDNRGNVREIISTSLQALLEHPARTFTYVEMKFLTLWYYEQQSEALRDALRWLIANQQWTIVNGGWCMHDEAAAHYMGMIDQTTLGHAFLRQELGVVPKTAWQLDPFGHSLTQAKLLTHRAGMNALYFGRIDHQDLKLRRATKQCEGLWNTSSADIDNEEDSTIFWGLTGSYGGNYGTFPGFCFDATCSPEERLVGLNHTALQTKIHTFLEDLRVQSDQTADNHVMLTFGMDFQYSEAHINFANMDLLIGTIMSWQQWGQLDVSKWLPYDRVQIFYSTPDYYTECKHGSLLWRKTVTALNRKGKEEPGREADSSFDTKTDDFFPYADAENSYWSGYFTSRTAFKRLERVASSFLLASRQIDALLLESPTSAASTTNQKNVPLVETSSGRRNVRNFLAGEDSGNLKCDCCKGPLYALEDALGMAQHHDAVSGTAKQHVSNDYSKHLHHGIQTASKHVLRLLQTALQIDDELKLEYCPLLNETICPVSVRATKSNSTSLQVVIYNPLAQDHSTVLRLPVGMLTDYTVENLSNPDELPIVIQSTIASHHTCCQNKYVLMWQAKEVPALGLSTYRISRKHQNSSFIEGVSDDTILHTREEAAKNDGGDEDVLEVSNGLVTVQFQASTGQLKQIEANGVQVPMEQTWGYYTSFDSSFDKSFVPSLNPTQNSGAYIFRPSTPIQDIQLVSPRSATIVNTTVGTEVHVSFAEPWIHQVTRVLEGQPYVEVEYTVGPVPIDDGRGKEIVTRYNSGIVSDGAFFTDSNGREFLRRQRNFRPSWNLNVYEPVAGNYYPVTTGICLEDNQTAMAVVVDRSQGGTSLQDGVLELMVQRRTLADDNKGVGEAMNETCEGMTPYPPYGHAERVGKGVTIRGVHRLVVGETGGARLARAVMDPAFAAPLVFIGESLSSTATTPFQTTRLSGLESNLPENVMLVSFYRWSGSSVNDENDDDTTPTFLLRLGHQYGVDEDERLSAPVKVDLTTLFRGYTLKVVGETTLTGNQSYKSFLANRLEWKNSSNRRVEKAAVSNDSDTEIVLKPMDIRTFQVKLLKRNDSD